MAARQHSENPNPANIIEPIRHPATARITAAYCHAQKCALLKAAHPFRTEDEALDYRDKAQALDDLIEALPICNSRDADAHVGLLEIAVENLFKANNESDRKAAHVRGLTLVAKLGHYLDCLDPAVDDIPLRRVWDEFGNKIEPANAELGSTKAEND